MSSKAAGQARRLQRKTRAGKTSNIHTVQMFSYADNEITFTAAR